MRATRIATVFQWVSDPAKSAEWYRRLLEVEPAPYQAPYFKLDGGAYLILGQSAPGTGRGGTGAWFEVDNVDEAYRQKLAEGFVFNEEPFDIPPGRLVTLNDPDGNIVGLIDNSKGGMPG
jgi:predicted enzyme related to lactoylglutathione lyase